jgi:nucleoid-associated protein YejK
MIANFGCYVLGLGGFLIFYKYEYIMVVFLMISVLGSSNCYIITFIFLIEIVEKKSS